MSADGHKTRPFRMADRNGLFTDEQVLAWRAERARRRQVLRETRSLKRMAEDAGVCENAMRELLEGISYKHVARNG
jgi:hypothetical protein